jgi:phenylacetic acid degradation protein paaN
MTTSFFTRHQALLDNAVNALATRGFWSPYPEVPSQKFYGEGANEAGRDAFEALLDIPYTIDGMEEGQHAGQEISPYGFALGITYPVTDVETLFTKVNNALPAWKKATPEVWTGVCLEILHRLNKRSFEMGYAVMHTTGQAFAMAFQAGGPHAQDRGLEAVATAWQAMQATPKTADWEKPQGKHAPLHMHKTYRIVPRGISLVIGCNTFPTWNSYPGLFASLATGNAVIVKPHPSAILPLAITVSVARAVLVEAGFNPDIVMLAAHDEHDNTAHTLALHTDVATIDFTGSSANGQWLETHARQAQLYTEKSGVNQIIIDATDDIAGLAKNIAFSLSLYSGQMCTAPQTIYIPKDGIETNDGHYSYDKVVATIAGAISDLVGDPAKAVEVLGAIVSEAVLARIEHARTLGKVILDSQPLKHALFSNACIRTPLLLSVAADHTDAYVHEHFGPIAFCVATNSTEDSLAIAAKTLATQGAITLSVYATDEAVIERTIAVAEDGGVALSINLTGGVFVNQAAGFSDFHGTGANPAANCTLTDAAFVANRFRVVQHRRHVVSA